MGKERRIIFEHKGERHVFLGTLEKLWIEYPGAKVKKIHYDEAPREEIKWRTIPGYKGIYEISNGGHIKRLPRLTERNGHVVALQEKIMKTNEGYIILYKNGEPKRYAIRYLLALVFNQ